MDGTIRAELSRILEDGQPNTGLRLALRTALVAMVVAAVLAAIVDTLPRLSLGAHEAVVAVQWLAALVFTAEYVVRLYIAPERDPRAEPRRGAARRRYALSFLGIVDVIVIVPCWIVLAVSADHGTADVMSLLVLLKLARYATALPLVMRVIAAEAGPLLSAMLTLVVLLVLASGIMFLLEHARQPEVFASIPDTLWWGIVTIATVGYGDMTPLTPLGRVFAGFVMVLGVGMFAVPAGILATGFATEIRRRNFIVTWQLVAKVPLFAKLDAVRIAGIAGLLKPQLIPEQHVIFRRGDPADGMYFILDGEVEVELEPRPVRLGKGQFFGEIALLRDVTRTATVTTVSECQLLSLSSADFKRLVGEYPDIRERIAAVSETRVPEHRDTPPPRTPEGGRPLD
ncbi:MAG TPA: ion transporter [Alphaproteobacteria bacterium]|jgi:voltage-gated potassium channel|nr:ion transporter [Alphaproteobacteria bacterium]